MKRFHPFPFTLSFLQVLRYLPAPTFGRRSALLNASVLHTAFCLPFRSFAFLLFSHLLAPPSAFLPSNRRAQILSLPSLLYRVLILFDSFACVLCFVSFSLAFCFPPLGPYSGALIPSLYRIIYTKRQSWQKEKGKTFSKNIPLQCLSLRSMICFRVSKTNEQEEKSYLARRNRHYVWVPCNVDLCVYLCVVCVWVFVVCVEKFQLCGWLCECTFVDVSSDCLFSFPSLYSQMLYYRLPDFHG